MKRRIKNILAIHLLNNFSGSPRILSDSLTALQEAGANIHLYTSKGPGLLDKLPVTYTFIGYKWHPNKWRRLLNFLSAQWQIFWKVIQCRKNIDLVYINTLLPGAGAVAARLLGVRMVYHIHETHLGEKKLDWLMKTIFKWTANEAIFVSDFLSNHYSMSFKVQKSVIPNSVEPTISSPHVSIPTDKYDILMISSLKWEKGLMEFIKLAQMLESFSFLLIIGTQQHNIENFFSDIHFPSNLEVLPFQQETGIYYMQSRVLLNLSHPSSLPVSFGMTILEGLKFGLPSIVPLVGGPSELIQDGIEGFHISCFDFEKLTSSIKNLLSDEKLYKSMSTAARKRSLDFSNYIFKMNICKKKLFSD
mgnify:CR=1 FL=1